MVRDLIIVGGGINGTGIAMDAAGRGLSVLLLEEMDLASATSSASSKLIHGGLRYLEQYQFRLVRESLAEREVLLKIAPHLISPLRFCLPYQPHLRSKWLIRFGLFLYDNFNPRRRLTASRLVRFRDNDLFKSDYKMGFEYSDCSVDDARLVIANALEVRRLGGKVYTRIKVNHACRQDGLWVIEAIDLLTQSKLTFQARGLVNATGPWVQQFYKNCLKLTTKNRLRLIKGSHIVVPKINKTNMAYILQNQDKRIVFVLPWLNEYSIIGTTDIEFNQDPRSATISEQEVHYLLASYNTYFKHQLVIKDIVWHYSGVRALYADHADHAQDVTRDYVLELSAENGTTPLLSVFGGKITTYRKLAEQAMKKLADFYPNLGENWTQKAILPGGDMGMTRPKYIQFLLNEYPWLPVSLAERYTLTYGTYCEKFLTNARQINDLGIDFGHGLHASEVRYLVFDEWAQDADDILWRRTKLGMKFSQAQRHKLTDWLNKIVRYRYNLP